MSKPSLTLAFCLCLGAAACGETPSNVADDATGEKPSTSPMEDVQTRPTAPAPGGGTGMAPTPTTPAPGEAAAGGVARGATRVVIDGEGLRLMSAETGSMRPLPFGTARATIETGLTNALGAPRGQGINAECGNNAYVTWPSGLITWFDDDRLVGWNLAPNAGGDAPRTASSVGMGSTRAFIEEASVIEVRQTSLGTEFTSGDLAGLLASEAANARVTALWAGNTCIAR